jgi:hypothetical protein
VDPKFSAVCHNPDGNRKMVLTCPRMMTMSACSGFEEHVHWDEQIDAFFVRNAFNSLENLSFCDNLPVQKGRTS